MAFAIPISVFSSFYFFYLFGITINTLTLTGIALAVGMLLDNSIVVMENIYRLKGLGVSTDEACVRGTTEVWKAIMAATVTTITVFLPFLFADNYLVKLIGEHIGISIVATLPYRWSWPCCDTDGGKRYFAQDSGRCQFQ